MTFDGTLALAPVKNPHMVLDFGTGTGIWAMEYGIPHLLLSFALLIDSAIQNPSAVVLGTDLSAIQPLEYI